MINIGDEVKILNTMNKESGLEGIVKYVTESFASVDLNLKLTTNKSNEISVSNQLLKLNKKYKIGQIFKIDDNDDRALLVQINNNEICAISLIRDVGNRYMNPIKVNDPKHITTSEMDYIFGSLNCYELIKEGIEEIVF